MHKADAPASATFAAGNTDSEANKPAPSSGTASGAAESRVPIFALPEHQVIEGLLPQLITSPLDINTARQRLRDNPQLVPVGLNPHLGLLYFADLGDHRYQEWQHIYSVQQLALKGSIRTAFSAPASLLDADDLISAVRPPRGFILHVSRCGSTLLGKALARADGIGIINQPAVLQHGFWAWISGNWQQPSQWEPLHDERNCIRFRNLMHLLCQRRRADEDDIFVKFISWNTLYADFIHACFPDTPMLYMYRNPVEVIASVQRETTAILMARQSSQAQFLSHADVDALAAMDDVDYLAACYAHSFARILDTTAHPKMLNYAGFKPDTLLQVLAGGFDLCPPQAQLQQMLQQFQVYSKDDQNQTSFKDDSHSKRNALSDAQIARIQRHCGPGWQRLLASPHNIIPCC